MDTPSDYDNRRKLLLERIEGNLMRVESRVRELRSRNNRFIYISLITSGLATVIAGQAAAFGQLGAGPDGWRLTCGIVAVCTASATVFSALHKQFGISDNLARATLCAGRLHGLVIAMTITNRDIPEVAHEYEDVVANFREFLI